MNRTCESWADKFLSPFSHTDGGKATVHGKVELKLGTPRVSPCRDSRRLPPSLEKNPSRNQASTSTKSFLKILLRCVDPPFCFLTSPGADVRRALHIDDNHSADS